ncbi:MAG: 1-(5-phosphoribosyl)-5-[(5-phosphoribosylamino)methylideneamino] imidazole-4-carboxamide isomerase [Acidimicrobiia bacterium]|nr:1-(5-phosphoribosyl)-5-[(5-phosphoribosylamino)methylideneamino] imidazole-4-carboxamide isomerase [Acidimicrobiia bacterium]
MYVIPAVDILDGKVVRLRQGRYDEVTVYAEDPAKQLQVWGDQGARIVHVVDLAGARDGSGDRATLRRLGRSGVPFQIGGGIRTRESAEAVIASGASRVVLGTAAVWNPGLAAEIVSAVGAEQVVAAVDVREGKATGAGWLDEGRELDDVLSDITDAGVVRALATGIATDGTLAGPDVALLQKVIALAPELAVIASGGVGTVDDISAVAQLDVEAAIVGRALYDARFTFAEAAAAAAQSLS